MEYHSRKAVKIVNRNRPGVISTGSDRLDVFGLLYFGLWTIVLDECFVYVSCSLIWSFRCISVLCRSRQMLIPSNEFCMRGIFR